MEIVYEHDKKFCTVWLTNKEKNDDGIITSLQPIFAEHKQKGYITAVFESGAEDLFSNTLDLLKYNKRRIAELEVQNK